MKISRKQLRRIILEQAPDAPDIEISGDSDAAQQIVSKVKDVIDQKGGAVDPDNEDFTKALEDEGIDAEKKGAFIDKYLARLRGGDVTDKEQVQAAMATESKITRSGLRKLIIQELAELIIEPESPCAAPQKNVMHKHDHEGKMARKQLDRTASLSHSLADRMDDNMQLPAWVQSKITKAADYIQSVHNYLDEDLHEGKKKKKKSSIKHLHYPYAYGVDKTKIPLKDEDDAELDAFVFGGDFGAGGDGGGGE